MLIGLPKAAQTSGYLISLQTLAVLNSEGIRVCNASCQQDGHQGKSSSNGERWKQE